jgi:hypothetical protein
MQNNREIRLNKGFACLADLLGRITFPTSQLQKVRGIQRAVAETQYNS